MVEIDFSLRQIIDNAEFRAGTSGSLKSTQMFLAAIVACNVDLVATHAVPRGEVYIHFSITYILLQSNFV